MVVLRRLSRGSSASIRMCGLRSRSGSAALCCWHWMRASWTLFLASGVAVKRAASCCGASKLCGLSGRERKSIPMQPLPLAFFPEPCVFRSSAIDTLQQAKREFEIVYVSPSYAGVKAAARAGLAMTPLPASVMEPGLRSVSPAEGAPALPPGEFVLFRRADQKDEAIVEELANALRGVRF